jgi:AAA family ATP:ADP antiporter
MLRPFTDVRAGESGTVLLLTFNIFLILAAYYFIKPVRDALILSGSGAEWKSYLSAGQIVLLLGAVPLYGALASRMPRRRLINVVTTFFAACLALFFIAFQFEVPLAVQGTVFFLWSGIFNLMVVAQFWSFANDIYSRDQGERLFPIVGFGASFGAVFGSFALSGVIEIAGLYVPMIVAGGLLMASLLITNYVDARERRVQESDLPNSLTTGALPAASQEIPLDEVRKALTGEIPLEEVKRALTGEIDIEDIRKALETDEPPAPEDAKESLEQTLGDIDLGGEEGPYRMVLRCSYLLMIALLVLVLTWVNTNGQYILDKLVEVAASDAVTTGQVGGLSEGEYIASFYSRFFGVVNALGLFIQLFLVSRAIKYLGVQGSLLVLPLIALGSNALIVLYPVLSVVRWGKTMENATDYSLQNTVRNVLFLPCTREQKYKAKQAIDSFFARSGDVLSAAVVYVGTVFLALGPKGFAAFNVILVAVAIVLAVGIGRQYRRLVASGQPPCQ